MCKGYGVCRFLKPTGVSVLIVCCKGFEQTWTMGPVNASVLQSRVHSKIKDAAGLYMEALKQVGLSDWLYMQQRGSTAAR